MLATVLHLEEFLRVFVKMTVFSTLLSRLRLMILTRQGLNLHPLLPLNHQFMIPMLPLYLLRIKWPPLTQL
jgi:hypothetical protein